MKKFLSTRIAVALVISPFFLVGFITSAPAAEPVARAVSEPAIGGLTPGAYLDRQLELNEWLMSQLPDGTLDATIRVPLTGKDRRDIANDNSPNPRPRRVGIVKRVGRNIKIWRGGRVAKAPAKLSTGVIRGTDDGGFAWAVAFESEGAAALRIQLSDVSLPDSADIYFFALDGQAHGPYRGRDAFWSDTLMGSQGIVLIRQFGRPRAGTRAMSVSVSSVGNLGEQFEVAAEGGLCTNNHACIVDAEEYDFQPVTDLQAATAYMSWVQGAWIYSCSGGLLADMDESGQIPYFLTANHCLKSKGAARNLELFWNYKTVNGVCVEPTTPKTMGATVKVTGPQGDFTLLQLDQAPPPGSVLMGWTNADVANTPGVNLHRVHHPKGSPQSYTAATSDPNFGSCSGLSRPQFIYSLDYLGSTEAGSSGSLVANDAGEVVGQLYGGCGGNFDECTSLSWRTVDGAFSFYYDRVAPFLGSSCDSSLDEICDDNKDNDCDSDTDCDDSDCSALPICDVPDPICAPKNDACEVDDDCCSTRCKPNGRCR